ncbi:MAG: Translation initiation factor 6 [ANME-2 cluster archaeon]|nr:Translation initiation factor 6 [ANME-2 cluster archaeon]
MLSLSNTVLKASRRGDSALDRKLTLYGSTVLGIFATVTENVAFVPEGVPDAVAQQIEDVLQVRIVPVSLAGSSIVGSLLCGNCAGFVVSKYAHPSEIEELREFGDVQPFPSLMNACGNIILANDTAAIVHPLLSDRAVAVIRETMQVDVQRSTIAGLETVGMAGIATNKGVLVHPKVSDAEIAILEDVFGLPVDIGTVNFGSPLIGAGLLANSSGYLAGADTTGHELGRIEDALGFI